MWDSFSVFFSLSRSPEYFIFWHDTNSRIPNLLKLLIFGVMFFCQRPQLVKGNMQLFAVDQQRSQALEAHAASFASFRVHPSSMWFIYVDFNCVACRFNFVWYCNVMYATYRLLEMRRIRLLFVLHPRPSMLDRSRPSCMSLNLVHSQV